MNFLDMDGTTKVQRYIFTPGKLVPDGLPAHNFAFLLKIKFDL